MTYDKTEMNAFVQNLYDQKMLEGKHGHYETIFSVVHAAIAAYQAKLRQGVEMPEPAMKTHGAIDTTERHWFTKDQLQQYAAAAAAQARVKAIEQCLIKVTGLSVDVERCKQLQLTTQAWEEALDAAANAIEQLKVKK